MANPITVHVFVTDGLDATSNAVSGEESVITLRVNPDLHTLRHVHEHVKQQLAIESDAAQEGASSSSSSGADEESAPSPGEGNVDGNDLFYIPAATSQASESYDMGKTFHALGIAHGMKIWLDSRARRQKEAIMINRRLLAKPVLRFFVAAADIDGNDDDAIELTVTTRLLDAVGQPLRPIRAVVMSTHLISYLMEDVTSLWGKANLKFRCGRNVLSADKTYIELGVVQGAEVVVTGGRG
jgi:hypothetical protein